MVESSRLVVRRFTPDDGPDLHAYLSLESTYRFEPGAPVTEAEARALAADRSRSDSFLAVVLKSNQKMVGHLYFSQSGPVEFLTWELGYIFHPAYQNQGLCTEASRLIVDHGFRVLGAHRVVAYCDPLNPASWKVLEKVGLKREGYAKKKAFFRRDAQGTPLWHDCYSYGLVDEDYLGGL